MLSYLPPLPPELTNAPAPGEVQTHRAGHALHRAPLSLNSSKLQTAPRMELAPGRYDLMVTRDGYKSVRKQVTQSAQPMSLSTSPSNRKRSTSSLYRPPRAESTIKFDNSKLEYRPGVEVEPGRYDLFITHEGYKPVRKQVTISTADVTLPVTLDPDKVQTHRADHAC